MQNLSISYSSTEKRLPSHQTAVMVGLSGGVDSAVAALLLQKQGYAVQSLFMKNWEEDDKDNVCTAAQDLSDALAISIKLNISLHKRNFSSEYWEKVFSHCLNEFNAGRTPNPDILCNSEIKFKTFFEHAFSLGVDFIATGHYARIIKQKNQFQLLKAKDENKDQSYFLYRLTQAQLARTLFPLGQYVKHQVRQIANENQFQNFNKKDSTGLCFIGERNFKTFLQQFLPVKPGEIKNTEGRTIGQHDGIMFYTLGQRKGLGIGGLANGDTQPWYVVDKNPEENTLIVVQGHNHPRLLNKGLRAKQLHWIAGHPPSFPLACRAKIRYQQADQICTITNVRHECCDVVFKFPQRAIAPGQSIVFYHEEECLGGGIIEHALSKCNNKTFMGH